MKLLIVEDDVVVVAVVRAILRAEGYEVDHASTGRSGLALALTQDYAGILLDLGLGDCHGVTVLQALRYAGVASPVLILTADANEATIVRALDAGADEYVVKPVRERELLARVRALLRRRERAVAAADLAVGSLTLSRLSRKAFVRGEPLSLSPKEFGLLEHFMQFVGEVLSRTTLLEQVWDMHFDPGSNVVDVHVKRLRHKLDMAKAPARIETHRGVGFALVAEPVPDDLRMSRSA